MSLRSASVLQLLVVALMSGMAVLQLGCATVDRYAALPYEEPTFFDPLEIRASSTEGLDRSENIANSTLRAIDDSLLNLTHRERIEAWDRWADAKLQDGDIVFLQSTTNWVWGFIELSQVTQDVTDSPFTHVALAVRENDGIVLYDIDTPGPSRTPFGMMMANSKTAAVGVKRLRPEFQQFVPGAVKYCRDVYASGLPFDKKMRLDNDRLYCAELIEVAFRASGLELSQPTRWQDLPGLDTHPYAVNTIAWANDTKPTEFVVVPGNDQIGIWASPGLELILPLTDSKEPPNVTR